MGQPCAQDREPDSHPRGMIEELKTSKVWSVEGSWGSRCSNLDGLRPVG